MNSPSTSVVLQNALISHTLTSLHLLHWHHARDLLGSLLEERTAATPAPLYLEHLDTPPLCTLQQHPPVLLTGTNMEGHIGMTLPTMVLDSLQSQLLPYIFVMVQVQVMTVLTDYAGTWMKE